MMMMMMMMMMKMSASATHKNNVDNLNSLIDVARKLLLIKCGNNDFFYKLYVHTLITST